MQRRKVSWIAGLTTIAEAAKPVVLVVVAVVAVAGAVAVAIAVAVAVAVAEGVGQLGEWSLGLRGLTTSKKSGSMGLTSCSPDPYTCMLWHSGLGMIPTPQRETRQVLLSVGCGFTLL